jgi:light-regulated signal transduction histidine kinase (bacteriophytochrome)
MYTVILRDISARKATEEQIHRLNAELEDRVRQRTEALRAANQELEGFTYSVAHDLRAPLRHLDAFSRILLEEYAPQLPEEAQHFLKTIRQSSQNLSRLVDDLLNLARIGRAPLNREPTSLHEIVSSAISDLNTEARDRSVHWKVHPLPEAQCDPRLMKQVFLNLLSNAVKYTRPRPVAEIEIGVSAQNGATTVFVRDNGVGFDMKYKDKLFGVFQRLHRADEFEGTGVGLAIVERIIRKHGGSIWAESEVGKGATFFFTLEPPKSQAQGSDQG